jgi:PBP1b-binding outer membrane lipoprotein LpoB
MRKVTTGLLIAASALAIAGCEPTDKKTEAATAEATPVASDDATTATDAATEAVDPNGNPIKP